MTTGAVARMAEAPLSNGRPARPEGTGGVTDALVVVGRAFDSTGMVQRLSARGVRVVVVPRSAVAHADGLLRGALLIGPERLPISLPPCRLCPDVVLELPAPDRSQLGESIAATWPRAIFARPPAGLKPLDAMWRDQHQEDPCGADYALVRLIGGEGAVAIAGTHDPEWQRNFSEGGPWRVVRWAAGSDHLQLLRIRLVIDSSTGRVVEDGRAQIRPVPLLGPGADARATMTALARDGRRQSWRVAAADTIPEAALALCQAFGDRLLTEPTMIGTSESCRRLPVASFELLLSGTDEVLLTDVKWVTPGVGDDEFGGLERWLGLATDRIARRCAPRLELPRAGVAVPGGDVHSLAGVFPRLGNEIGVVGTRRWPGATFESLDPGLRIHARCDANDDGDDPGDDRHQMLSYLARVTDLDDVSRANPRFVEPGVGRTYLVSNLILEGRPEIHDFAVTGVGLTPYSAGGFATIGSPITGRAALVRVQHRRRVAERLERCGVRTAPVAAVISLPGEEAPLPDGGTSPAGLAIRGFRCILRVKQLDPVSAFYNALQLAPLVGEALLERPAVRPSAQPDGYRHALLRALDTFAGRDDTRRILWATSNDAGDPLDAELEQEAMAIRQALIYEYAPLVVEIARARVAAELERDTDLEPVSNAEYVAWFAEWVGRQLAFWYDQRFLHDYHKPGVRRSTGLLTLVEQNVTLLAEFPDLDTAVFVDDDEDADALQLTMRDREVLRTGFVDFHARELGAARAVVRTLALAVLERRPALADWADEILGRAYGEARLCL